MGSFDADNTRSDGGYDFVTPMGYKVDVKCNRADIKEPNLMVQDDDPVAAIFVLVRYVSRLTLPVFFGFAWRSEVMATPYRKEGWQYRENHTIHFSELHPLHEFDELAAEW